MNKLSVGDVVRLNSGSCPLTVEIVHDTAAVTCMWFTPDGLGGWSGPQREKFAIALLIPVDAIEPPKVVLHEIVETKAG